MNGALVVLNMDDLRVRGDLGWNKEVAFDCHQQNLVRLRRGCSRKLLFTGIVQLDDPLLSCFFSNLNYENKDGK